jgi:predicted TIM-barrel fold metal-dependent hydrolase
MILDAHHHIGELVIGDTGQDEGADSDPTSADAQAAHVAMLNSLGFSAAIVQPSLQYERPYGITNTQAVNDAIATYRDNDPRHFPVALGTVEPLHGTRVAEEELHRLATDLRLDGVTWHTRYQGVALSDRRMHHLVDVATELGLPCYLHVFAESNLEAPWMLEDIAANHAGATIVALDAFSAPTQINYIRGVADRCDNVLFDTALTFTHLRPLDRWVERFGSERLLFGTDAYVSPRPYNTPSVLHEINASDTLTPDDLTNIFWRNAVRVFPRIRERVSCPDDASSSSDGPRPTSPLHHD